MGFWGGFFFGGGGGGAVIGKYGPNLMIMLIFVTQNNFSNGPGNFDCLLGFYRPSDETKTISINRGPMCVQYKKITYAR